MFTLLSNAEQALRKSSNSNAPNQCWGCQGLFEDALHLYRDCPRRMHESVQANFQKNLQEWLQKKRAADRSPRFDPNNWKKDGFPSKQATTLFNSILTAPDATTRTLLVDQFVHENNSHSDTSVEKRILRVRKAARFSEASEGKSEGGTGPVALPFWVIQDEEHEDSRSFAMSFQFDAQLDGHGPSSTLRYPISSKLPHVIIPVGKMGQATVEGLLDTGGACTMGDLIYWKEVVVRHPELVAEFSELSDHQEKPISIGGVGAGKVEITHILGLWLPWMVGNKESKLVIGLGENMPVTLLIGLPFQVATQCVLDIGQLKCHSVLFNSTWKLSLEVPHKKTIRSLDANASSAGKRWALTTAPTPTKKIRWQDLEVVTPDEE